tara:strand:- start:6 stop:725 length:720 start_codon:yes stop_codon:yes gene_type:complete
MKTVYYHPWWQWTGSDGKDENPLDNPLFMEDVFIPPTTYKEYMKKTDWWDGFEYSICPAVSQYATTTFVFYAQTALHFRLTENEEGRNRIELLFNTDDQNNVFGKTVMHDQVVNDKAVLQFLPRYLLWTPNKNVWLEMVPVAFPIIPGTFPLSKWPRSANMTTLSIRGQEIKLNRGDPVFAIRFPDGNEKYELKMKRPTEAERVEQEQSIMLKDFLPRLSWPIALNREEKKKCPFRKFW